MGNAGAYFGRQDGLREGRDAERLALAQKLDEMQLDGETGTRLDEGYALAVLELRVWLSERP